LGAGAYRDDNNKPFVLPSVRAAEKIIYESKLDKEYLPIVGLNSFCKNAAKLAFGENSNVFKENKFANTQTISGTGALRLAGEFINRFHNSKDIYLPTPTWGNHIPIFKDSGLNVKSYGYYQPEGCKLNIGQMLSDIKNMPKGSTILLHACAHNPTGVDPSQEQWKEISQACKNQGLLVVFDMAYQGFASGNVDDDAFALRHFINEGHNVVLAQSFAKNFGLFEIKNNNQ